MIVIGKATSVFCKLPWFVRSVWTAAITGSGSFVVIFSLRWLNVHVSEPGQSLVKLGVMEEPNFWGLFCVFPALNPVCGVLITQATPHTCASFLYKLKWRLYFCERRDEKLQRLKTEPSALRNAGFSSSTRELFD